MSPQSLVEKLQDVWSVVISSPLYIIFFLVMIFLIYLFITTNGTNKKESKKAYILIYAAVIIYFMIQYGSSVGIFIDYAINQVFLTYYFPNIVIYLLMLIIASIILWKSIFCEKIAKPIKILNSTVYGILVYLFVLIISQIDKLKLDVFALEELYSNTEVKSLLELSLFLFVIWSAILLVYHFLRTYQTKHDLGKEAEATYEILEHANLERVYAKDINYKPKQTPVFFPEFEEEVRENTPAAAPLISAATEPFTLEEYKVIAKILKEDYDKKKILLDKVTSSIKEEPLQPQEIKVMPEVKREVIPVQPKVVEEKRSILPPVVEEKPLPKEDISNSLTELNALYRSIDD